MDIGGGGGGGEGSECKYLILCCEHIYFAYTAVFHP